jgi:hypothetical protein
MEEGKKCDKCGKDLCADCTCEENDTICKDCCNEEEVAENEEPEDCSGCCASCHAHDKE